MKGHAEIILTDVKSKKQEIIHEDNIVTNALQYFMQANLCLQNTVRPLFPLYKNGIGGIFLFGDNIEENPDIVTVPGDVSIVGHASNDAYMGEDNLRGSFNDSESEKLSNGMKLVWDFTTNQANGEIKCLSLTSSTGGKIGFGVQNNIDCPFSYQEIYPYVNATGTYSFYTTDILDDNCCYELSYKSNVFTINKYYFPITKFKLSSELYKKKLILTKELDTETSYIWYAKTLDDGNLYLFTYTYSIATLYIINTEDLNVISEADYTFVLKYIDLDYSTANIAVLDGYIYINCFKDKAEEIGVLKIKLNNINDIKLINLRHRYVCSTIFKMNNRICTRGAVIDKKDNVTYLNYTTKNYYKTPKYMPDLYKGLISYHTGSTSSGNYGYLCNNMNYIVTINNLAIPVVKTADKTMKIIYTLTDA